MTRQSQSIFVYPSVGESRYNFISQPEIILLTSEKDRGSSKTLSAFPVNQYVPQRLIY
jgi:hypothetical protein